MLHQEDTSDGRRLQVDRRNWCGENGIEHEEEKDPRGKTPESPVDWQEWSLGFYLSFEDLRLNQEAEDDDFNFRIY